jgi:peptidoglycan/xylan/chitin deacetylase (PgdA/CDA1 family)
MNAHPASGLSAARLGVAVAGALRAAALFATAAEPPAGAADGGLRIARFRGDRAAAVSFTFDDGFRGATEETVAMLAPHGFVGTFFICTGDTRDRPEDGGNRTSWARWKEIVRLGHEVGNHSVTHADLRTVDDAQLETEVDGAYDRILEKLGVAPFSFAFPFNARDERSERVVRARHRAFRAYQKFYGGEKWTLERANRWVDEAVAGGEWMVPMLHSLSKGYAAFANPADFDAHLQYVREREDRVWVDTFGRVARYVQQRDAATLVGSLAPGRATFTLTSPLDPAVHDVPLSIIIPASGAAAAKAVRDRGDGTLPVTVRPDRLLVEATPSDRVITVTWSTNPPPTR